MSGHNKGFGSATYVNTARFFKKRELQGFKPPRKKAQRRTTAKGADKQENKFDVSGVSFPGDDEAKVPVYETCDVVWRKINAYTRDLHVTQMGFVQDITRAAYPQGQKKTSKTMNNFKWKKGPRTGNTSAVFYAAYVFFEKLHIRDVRPKAKFWEEMENVWKKENGFDVEYPNQQGTLA